MDWKKHKDLILEYLRKFLYDWLLRRLLGSAVGWTWALAYRVVFGILWNRYLYPVLLTLWRKAETAVRKYGSRKKIKKVREAEGEEEFDEAFDDLP